jgi:hypothetical protein
MQFLNCLFVCCLFVCLHFCDQVETREIVFLNGSLSLASRNECNMHNQCLALLLQQASSHVFMQRCGVNSFLSDVNRLVIRLGLSPLDAHLQPCRLRAWTSLSILLAPSIESHSPGHWCVLPLFRSSRCCPCCLLDEFRNYEKPSSKDLCVLHISKQWLPGAKSRAWWAACKAQVVRTSVTWDEWDRISCSFSSFVLGFFHEIVNCLLSLVLASCVCSRLPDSV